MRKLYKINKQTCPLNNKVKMKYTIPRGEKVYGGFFFFFFGNLQYVCLYRTVAVVYI